MAFDVSGILGMDLELMLALLRVSPVSRAGTPLPAPLPLAARPLAVKKGRKVYVVGYPARDDDRNDPRATRRIFQDVYYFQRIQPGQILSIRDDKPFVRHVCSTLRGNAGSPLVDLQTNQVLGLQQRGIYLRYREALALWRIADHPLLKNAGVTFV